MAFNIRRARGRRDERYQKLIDKKENVERILTAYIADAAQLRIDSASDTADQADIDTLRAELDTAVSTILGI